MLINSVPLQKTGVAKDPKTPVHSSIVIDIVKLQSSRTTAFIPLYDVMQGDVHLADILKKANEDILVVDATSNEDIDVIAKSCIKSGIKFISVDPGPFSAAAAKFLFNKELEQNSDASDIKLINESSQAHDNEKKVLMIIGSTTDLTRKQMEFAF